MFLIFFPKVPQDTEEALLTTTNEIFSLKIQNNFTQNPKKITRFIFLSFFRKWSPKTREKQFGINNRKSSLKVQLIV